MSKKKVSAPLSYDPGRGRPKEYLAYLNWQEMQALQRLNGGNMEFGPRGLPSFPPDDAIGSSQNASTGNWSGAPGGTTSTGTSSSPSGSGTSTSWGGSNNYGTDSSSWAGSNSSYGGAGGAATSAASSASSTSASAASSNTTDTTAKQISEVRDARSALSSSGLADDAYRGGIASINVGPMNSPVKIGDGRFSQIVNAPTATASAVEDFYRNDQSYQSAVQQLRNQQEALRAPAAKVDAERISRESDAYDFMTDDQKQALLDKYSISGIVSSASNVASYVYNNPLDAAKGVIESAIAPAAIAGQYLMGEKSALDDRGNFTEEAADDLVNAAFSYGVGTGVASLAAPAPAGSVGVFMGPRASSQLRSNYEFGRDIFKKGATLEEVFGETMERLPPGVSGLQNIPGTDIWGYEMATPITLTRDALSGGNFLDRAADRVFGGSIKGTQRLGDVVDLGSLSPYYGGGISDIKMQQRYNPFDADYYTAEGKKFQAAYNPDYGISLNVPLTKGFMPQSENFSYEEALPSIVHEMQHAIQYKEGLDYGTSPELEMEDLVKTYGSNLNIPQEDLEALADAKYITSVPETIARLASERMNAPASVVTNWNTRLGANNPTWEEVKRLNQSIREAEERLRQSSPWSLIRLD